MPFHFHSSVALPDSKEKGTAAGQEEVGGYSILFVQHFTVCQARPRAAPEPPPGSRGFVWDFCAVISPGYKGYFVEVGFYRAEVTSSS